MSKSFECPNCGAKVPANAKSCPECGSDERTGWNTEATAVDGLDLPAGYEGKDDFDYDEYVRKEFGWDRDRGSKPPIPARQLLVPIIVVLLIAAFVWKLF